MLTDAKSIEIPPSYGPAGAHLAGMIEQLGIAEAVRPKLVIKTAIVGGAQQDRSRHRFGQPLARKMEILVVNAH